MSDRRRGAVARFLADRQTASIWKATESVPEEVMLSGADEVCKPHLDEAVLRTLILAVARAAVVAKSPEVGVAALLACAIRNSRAASRAVQSVRALLKEVIVPERMDKVFLHILERFRSSFQTSFIAPHLCLLSPGLRFSRPPYVYFYLILFVRPLS